ncbi:MAG: transcription/translation regulatory transformer protein RfaH [Nevskiaceae bacterium]|nr:MAG: transcription/translation regulatory transformer protein RfaH [Nevskiaceae bacterium]TBR73865.1 MAG: transcription/translation regulatory transformer protein RfaH [Nevskiaceae bacterium]
MNVAAPSPSARWFVVQCHANQNHRAQENLENQHFECFQPWLQMEKLRAGKRLQVTEPLFPGYLFVRLALSGQSWHTIRSTRGVRQLVRFGETIVSVADDVMHQLRSRCRAGENAEAPIFKPGDKLHIKSGPFANLDAVFQHFNGMERVVVLMEVLQQQQQVDLPLASVGPGT